MTPSSYANLIGYRIWDRPRLKDALLDGPLPIHPDADDDVGAERPVNQTARVNSGQGDTMRTWILSGSEDKREYSIFCTVRVNVSLTADPG